jgi:SAM-dependent methyltransferase
MPADTAVNVNSEVYYSGKYWNDLPQVLRYMSENFTGNPTKWWVDDFRDRYAVSPFQRALFLNCGNGWVEREFIDKGIVSRAVAFDYSIDLLRLAQRDKGTRPIAYFQADVNRVAFAPDQFDLVVNVAALHHVQYIHRLCRVLCAALRPGGLIVSFDYIGPRRNQYSLRQWLHIQRVNRGLPPHIRKTPLVRPHLPTMLYTDPTEAIHSDLIFDALGRFFDVFERHDTGGGVAYELLTHNDKIWSLQPADLEPHVRRVLEEDKRLSNRGAVPPLFSYFIARPRKGALADARLIARTNQAEARREAWASSHGGTYSYVEFGLAKTLPWMGRQARRLRLGRLLRRLG